jgi:hypothetical protein
MRSGVRGVTTARPLGVFAIVIATRALAVAFVGSACMITSVCVIVPIVGIVAEEIVIGVIFIFTVSFVTILGILVVVTVVVPGIGILVGGPDAFGATATGERRRSRSTRPIVA